MASRKAGNTKGKAQGPVSPASKKAEEANPPAKAESPAELSNVDALQLALDLAGMIPGAGAVPDLINAAISLMRGDFVGALFSAASAVPVVGDAAGAAKILKNSEKYLEALKVVEQKVLPKLPASMRKKLEEYLTKVRAKIDELLKKDKPEPKAKPKDKADPKKSDSADNNGGKSKGDPCKPLENGVPGDGYRGGRHGKVKEAGYSYDPKRESHHMPADSAYDKVNGKLVSSDYKPAIQMDKSDHMQTKSWGSGKAAVAYRNTQSSLMKAGKAGYLQALMMDIADIRSKFGDKYDGAIAQHLAWSKCKGYI